MTTRFIAKEDFRNGWTGECTIEHLERSTKNVKGRQVDDWILFFEMQIVGELGTHRRKMSVFGANIDALINAFDVDETKWSGSKFKIKATTNPNKPEQTIRQIMPVQ